jgi:hypothetical protein
MKYKNFFSKCGSLILLTFAMIGCVPKPIDIDVAPAAQKIVVASQIIPNETILIALTKSFTPLDPVENSNSITDSDIEKRAFNNAFVTVSYNGRLDTLHMIFPGLYSSENTITNDYTVYNLYARDPFSGLEISATTTLLPQVKFDTIYPVRRKSKRDTSITINYELSDNLQEENFYVMSYPTKKTSKEILTKFEKESKKIISKNICEFDLLTDTDFTNGKIKKSLKLAVDPNDTIAIQVANINKDYFEFLKTYKKSGNFINTVSGEPITYPTNVINGLGYFNAYFPDARVFFLRDY